MNGRVTKIRPQPSLGPDRQESNPCYSLLPGTPQSTNHLVPCYVVKDDGVVYSAHLTAFPRPLSDTDRQANTPAQFSMRIDAPRLINIAERRVLHVGQIILKGPFPLILGTTATVALGGQGLLAIARRVLSPPAETQGEDDENSNGEAHYEGEEAALWVAC